MHIFKGSVLLEKKLKPAGHKPSNRASSSPSVLSQVSVNTHTDKKRILHDVIINFLQIAHYSTEAIVTNLASNVNLSHYMDLWTLESKLQKNNCWTFFQ